MQSGRAVHSFALAIDVSVFQYYIISKSLRHLACVPSSLHYASCLARLPMPSMTLVFAADDLQREDGVKCAEHKRVIMLHSLLIR